MGDPLTTGLHTTHYLVNTVFDRIPASAFSGATYKRRVPSRFRKSAPPAAIQGYKPARPVADEGEVVDERGTSAYPPPLRDYAPVSSASASPQRYSQSLPRDRPDYTPRDAGKYYPPPPPLPHQAYEDSELPSRRVRDDQDAQYNSTMVQRPDAAIRRSSSFNGHDGPRYTHRVEHDATSQEHHLREDFLTKSPEGLAAGGVGALVGGYLAEKAQVKGGREEKSSGSLFLTGLGAVVGGLAANAAVDHYQHKKKQDEREDLRWERKFGETAVARTYDRARSGRHSSRRLSDSRDIRDSRDGDGRSRRGSNSRDSDYYQDSDYDRRRGGTGRTQRAESLEGDQRSSYSNSPHMSGGLSAASHYHGERDGRGYQPYGEPTGYYH